MSVRCNCGWLFKVTGIRQHLRQSKNLKCRAAPYRYVDQKKGTKTDNNDSPSHSEPSPKDFSPTSGDLDGTSMEVDQAGDFFGDYTSYSPADFGMPETEDILDGDFAKAEDDEEEDIADEDKEDYLHDSLIVEMENGLEVNRDTDDADPEQGPADSDEQPSPVPGPSHQPFRLRGGAPEEGIRKEPFSVRFTRGEAGKVYLTEPGRAVDENSRYSSQLADPDCNPYAPFTSKRDWEIARWAKLRGSGSTAFSELIGIEGVVEALNLSYTNANQLNDIIDKHIPSSRPRFVREEILIGGEICEVYFRDVIECLRSLYGDPELGQYLVFAPEKHYTDETKSVRLYHDMHTGNWWWATQKELEKATPGATIIPVIISTDKTQLTLFRNKSAYPIYLTIGNIPKEIRRKPSKRAYILLGYLPTTRLEGISNKAQRRRCLANLYHACMSRVLAPLEDAGSNGLMMTSGNGLTRRCHPLLACVVDDYPEQVLTTCTYTGQCPTCTTPHDEFGEFFESGTTELRDLEAILTALDTFDEDPAGYLQTCLNVGIKPVIEPFWSNLPYSHIFRSITPDVLHQLYQGILKHLIGWVTTALGAAEVDARCRRMPPNHNIRHFVKGISTLSRVSGHEHDQMCRILLGLVIDAPLPNDLSNIRLVAAVRSLLDFLYLAQLPVHSDETLTLLEEALERFHNNKSIFVDLGIRENFNLPKLHFANHYAEMIKRYGTTDNVDTQYTERLHIDFAKDAYAATNHKDEFSQMTLWLERKEKILRHDQFIKWRLAGCPAPSDQTRWSPPGLELDRFLRLTKHPTKRAEPLDTMINEYGAIHFRNALARYLLLANDPDLTGQALERKLWTFRLPFARLPVWHRLKFQRVDPYTGVTSTADIIHSRPAKTLSSKPIPARFDTAWIDEDGIAGDVGVDGFRVGRVRVVFSIPERFHHIILNEGVALPDHLAYVEWYTPLQDHPEPHHLLYKVRPERDPEGRHTVASIIPVEFIRRSVHLFPKFGRAAPVDWTSNNVLDLCSTFFVNTFTDKHFYRISF